MNLEHIRYAPLLTLWKAIAQMDLAYFESVQLPKDVRLITDLSYGEDPMYHRLDIAYPETPMDSYPVIVQVHGGGWVYGTKDTIYKAYGMAMAQKGFAVITFNYRLAPTQHFPTQLVDIDQIMLFIEKHAKQYSLDTQHVFMVGDSAGAHLVSLFIALQRTRLSHPFQFQSKIHVSAVALSCGVYDFDSFNTSKIKFPQKTNTLRSLFGVNDVRTHPMYRWSSTLSLMEESFTDTLIISSQSDPLYPQTIELINKLNEKKVIYKSIIAEKKLGLPHVFNTRLSYAKSVEVLNEIADFFHKRVNI
ncbi:MAG: alpha/beta hydrolase [Erysipelotrichaceae bacterium]|nr:alpha/beta hydrolase [Erysipelotrichaceae bacterium]MDP3304943.1 alpha/beta hydrolase [Erysipelotrichaceae bacterium]